MCNTGHTTDIMYIRGTIDSVIFNTVDTKSKSEDADNSDYQNGTFSTITIIPKDTITHTSGTETKTYVLAKIQDKGVLKEVKHLEQMGELKGAFDQGLLYNLQQNKSLCEFGVDNANQPSQIMSIKIVNEK